jgi:DNA invertase Pin-like site-specific DNA recombinase
MFTILAGMAEFERELIRSRIQDALDRRFDQKRLIGTVPYGYILRSDGGLEDNPAEQAVIRRIAHLRDDVKCSYGAIAAQLNADGVPTKTGKGKWQCGNVAGVLNSKHTARLLGEPEDVLVS